MNRRVYAENRIKQVRKALGLTLEELAARMQPESTASTIAKLENRGMALSLDYILAIATALGVPPSELVETNGPVATVRAVPVAGRISAGDWQQAVEMSDEAIYIPSHLKGDHLFALRPVGDSMNKLVAEGGYVIVNPDDKELRDKRCYAVMNGDGECTFKMFSANPMQLLPCSTNPEHKPIPIGSSPFTVIGRVIYTGHDL